MNRKGLQFHLNPAQVEELIRLAKFKPRDVFYDLGCGKGQVVTQVVKDTSVKKAIGVETDQDYYVPAREEANRLSWEQLQRIDFWFGDFQDIDKENFYCYDSSDATVIYHSLHESLDDMVFYKYMYGKRRIRLITKDLPLVGYASEANRENEDCWLFLTKLPLKKESRIRKKETWAESVLGVPNMTIDHVYSYYGGQLSKRRAYSKRGVVDTLLELEILVNNRF